MHAKNTIWRAAAVLWLALLLAVGGCANKQPGRNNAQPARSPAPAATPTSAPTVRSAKMLLAGETIYAGVPVYREAGGRVWVPMDEAAKSLGLNLHQDNGAFAFGQTDPAYSGRINETRAKAGDQPVDLPEAPRSFNGKPYITTQSLSTLMGTQVKWNDGQSQVILSPIDDISLARQQPAPGFAPPQQGTAGPTSALGTNAVNKGSVISFAQRLRGTPYHFGAGPFESTHAFDSSSFTQYVYGHYGVGLPRTTRSQAQVGQTVDANSLQPGDLMFFYTPGRYANNRIVGHVGLYAGNGKIIQTYGSPGVTVSSFNAYWRNRFLFAKRVA